MNDPIRATAAPTTRLPRAILLRSHWRRVRTRLALGALLLAASAGAWAAQGGSPNPTTIIVTPASVTFNTIVGATSSVTVQLGDLTSQNLNVGSITLTGTAAADYRLSATCLTPGSVVTQKGGACQIGVTFTPTALGARPAAISFVFGNAPTATLPLNGAGISATPPPPVITFGGFPASGTAGFGSVPVGGNAVFLMQISNTGGATLMQTDTITGTNSADFIFGGTPVHGAACQNVLLISNQNLPCNLGIVFVPTAVGPRTATLQITTNDPNHPTINLVLTGVGTPAPPPPPPPPPSSFTDVSGLWGNTAEPGWALSISHHKFSPATNVAPTDGLVAYWTTFDTTGQATWFVLRDGTWTDSLNYTGGVVHRFTGSPFTGPYLQSQLTDTVVGSGSLTFTDSSTGTLNFTINGFAGSKAITKNPFNF